MYKKHLSKDKVLKQIIGQVGPVALQKQDKIYLRLCRSILSQQLSVAVARVLYQRFLDLYNGKEPSLKQILETPPETMRSLGFSQAKSQYVHNVCEFFAAKKLTDRQLHEMADENVIQTLTQIKGIGRWTAEMILIFSLAREDVFPIDDLGVRKAMIDLYDVPESSKATLYERLNAIAAPWSPYRSYASLYLWRYKDGGGL